MDRMVCWEFKLCCEVLFLMNVMWIVLYVEGYGVSSAEYRVHLVSV